jgi:hypothetical protein
MSELDAIVEQSLPSFYQDICADWCGRENEIVNLYALGHLAKHVRPDTILHDLTKIGIEVTVRQLHAPTSRIEVDDSPQRFGNLARSANDAVEGTETLQ